MGSRLHDYCDIRVFTLNIWGLKGVSDKRKERVQEIGRYLSSSDYDVVLLQEVWNQSDYDTIREFMHLLLQAQKSREKILTQENFPFSHFFDNGIIGTGTCILSRVQIFDATFHEFSMNGYPHKIFHGDWFGGKGLGVCQIMFKGFDIHVYTSHYHAEYSRSNDVYLGHRVLHALESAQWIKLASSSADLTIYAGDFNTEPGDVPYKILRSMTPLTDCWEEHNGPEGGESNGTPSNSFTSRAERREAPEGKRIDYIMYLAGPNVSAETMQCCLPLPDRIPEKPYSYSDHEAVCATLRLRRNDEVDGGFQRGPDYRRMVSRDRRTDCVRVVREAHEILAKSDKHVKRDKIVYGILSFFFLLLFIASFLPSVFVHPDYFIVLDVILFLPRVVLSVGLVFFILMATLFNKKETNSLESARKSLVLVANQDASTGNKLPGVTEENNATNGTENPPLS